MSYDDAGLGGQALFPFMKVLMLDPDNQYALNNAGGLPGLLEARRLLLQILAESPDSYEARMLLGTDFYLTGAYTKAEQTFRSAFQLRPQSAWPLRWLGRVYLKTGKIDSAREYYQKAAGLKGTDANLEFQRATVEALGNNPAGALRHLDFAFRLGYKNFETLRNTAELNLLRRLPEFQRLLHKYFPGMVDQTSQLIQ
jgi:tetratricopeptide (TPR) repeat protein